MKRFIYCLLVILWPASYACAQSAAALNIGDKLPPLTLTNVSNYPAASLDLSGFRGKMLILDFWGTWCSACIESMPKIQSLQQEFKNELSVVLVNTSTTDKPARVKAFFEKYTAQTGNEISLPSSLLQKPLEDYFPYRFAPHYVWIDKNGIIIAITSQIEVTATNIRAALQGNTAGIHMKKDLLDFDHSKPLYVNSNGGDGTAFIQRSVLTPYLEGLGNSAGIDRTPDGKITRLYFINNALFTLLRMAWPAELASTPNRLVLETRHAAKLVPATNDSMLYTNAFCYDISIPPADMTQLRLYMQQDIRRSLHLAVRSQERNMACMSLTAVSPACYTKTGAPVAAIEKRKRPPYLRNQPLSVFVNILNHHPAFRHKPFIDESGITQHIDVAFPAGFYEMDIPAVKLFLEKLGFRVQEGNKTLPVTLITDEG